MDETMTIALLIIAALADAYTSHRLFKIGGTELNLLVKALFGKRPSFGAMLAVKSAALAALIAYGTEGWHMLGIALWGGAAAWNWRIYRKMRDG